MSLARSAQEPEGAESIVVTIMSRASDGTYTSWDEKDLNRLGDASAVALTKVIGGRDLDSSEIRQALLVLSLSFDAPRLIARDSDRNPRSALFLLQYLKHLPADAELKGRIEQTEMSLKQVKH
jgi:hypothetical protein